MAKEKKTEEATSSNNKQRKWMVPHRRAKGYAEERKAKVHQRGPKEGQELDDYNKGFRSGYLYCQSDHAGMHIYKTALNEGKSPSEARRLSRIKGKKKN